MDSQINNGLKINYINSTSVINNKCNNTVNTNIVYSDGIGDQSSVIETAMVTMPLVTSYSDEYFR